MQPGATPPEDPPPQRDDPPSSERVLLGYNGNLILRENGVLITRGAKGFWTQGSIRGEKLIPWESVVAVQFKKAGFGLQGYLQLSLRGGSEAKSGIGEAIKDENTVHGLDRARTMSSRELLTSSAPGLNQRRTGPRKPVRSVPKR